MTFVVLYALAGGAACLFAVVRKLEVAGLPPVVSAVVVLAFWPFVLPVAVFEEPAPGPVNKPGAGRLASIEEQLAAVEPLASDFSEVEVLVTTVRQIAERADGMERTMVNAPASAQPELQKLFTLQAEHLEANLSVLEIVVSKLHVLFHAKGLDRALELEVSDEISTLLSQAHAMQELEVEAVYLPPRLERRR